MAGQCVHVLHRAKGIPSWMSILQSRILLLVRRAPCISESSFHKSGMVEKKRRLHVAYRLLLFLFSSEDAMPYVGEDVAGKEQAARLLAGQYFNVVFAAGEPKHLFKNSTLSSIFGPQAGISRCLCSVPSSGRMLALPDPNIAADGAWHCSRERNPRMRFMVM